MPCTTIRTRKAGRRRPRSMPSRLRVSGSDEVWSMVEEVNHLTPEAIITSVEHGLMAERKRLSDANLQAKESKDRIKKAEKLLNVLRKTFNIPAKELVVAVPVRPKPEGIEVIDDEDDEEGPSQPRQCPDCDFYSDRQQAMAMHRKFKHGDFGKGGHS